MHAQGQLRIANRIYQEIIPRELTYSTQLTIPEQPANYIRPDGRLDMVKLLTAFQQFFRENAEIWLERFDYKEAGPQLLMQAFLQRIVNGGGEGNGNTVWGDGARICWWFLTARRIRLGSIKSMCGKKHIRDGRLRCGGG